MRDVIKVLDASKAHCGKPSFANRAAGFANRVRELPGLPLYFVSGAAAVLLMATSGAFGTLAIPLPSRLLFWTLLIGANVILWILWFAWRVRDQRDWLKASLLGMIVVNFPMPLEIGLIGDLLDLGGAQNWLSTWGSTLVISVALLLVLTIAIRGPSAQPDTSFPKGMLWRAGFREEQSVAAMCAEDHYCRVWRTDGTSALLHARFSDLVGELAGLDGALIRRGQWVAAKSIAKIERNGRKWNVRLVDGRSVIVSSSAASELRKRGWI